MSAAHGEEREAPPLTRPPRLQPGDRVAVVAPSGPIDPDRLDKGLQHLRDWGLRPEPGRSVRARIGYLAGTDAERAADFGAAWADDGIRAVLCARGGFGAQRMADLVDWAALRTTSPKVLVGFSDVTALHEAVATELGLVSVLGPMPASEMFLTDAGTREHLRRTFFEPESVQRLSFADAVALRPGRVRGVTVGGTIALLSSNVGTPHSRPARDGIVVLEDVAEPPYRLDRALTHLLRSGWFAGARGLVLGTFEDCGPYDEVLGVLEDRLGGLGVPVLHGVGIGHGARTQTVPLGVPAVLDTEAATLTLDVPALR